MSKTILWFRQDFRLDDHPALIQASKLGQPILPVVIVDPRWFETTRLELSKMGRFRATFWKESIEDLAESIESQGGTLIIREGHPESVLSELVHEYDVSELVA